MLRALLVTAFFPLALLVIVPTALSAIPGRAWVLRVCDFPRAQLMWTGVGLLAVGAVMHLFLNTAMSDAWSVALWALTVGLIIAVFIQIWWAVRLTPLVPPEIRPGAVDDYEIQGALPRVVSDRVLRVITANVDYKNEARAEAMGELMRWDPDLLALAEPDGQWEPLIERLGETHPWQVSEICPLGRGMALLSKFPIEAAEIRHLVEDKRPSIWADLAMPNNGLLKVVVLHPAPPGLSRRGEDGRISSAPRDIELEVAARVIGRHPDENWLVAGDLNDVGWSATTIRAKRVSKLGDPRIGRGMYSTFPASWPFCRYPIDHLLVSRSMRMLGLKRLDNIGSDHLPLMADFEMPGAVQAES